jgi:hypothetical protein
MGMLTALPEETFVMGRMELSDSFMTADGSTYHEYEMVYYDDLTVDEDTNQIYVGVPAAMFPVHFYIRIKYDRLRKFKSGRWTIQLMEFIEPKDRGSDKNTYYKCFRELPGRYNTPLAAHRAALDHIRFKENRKFPKVGALMPWYVPPQIR